MSEKFISEPINPITETADGARAKDKAAGEGVNQDDVPRPEDGWEIVGRIKKP